MQHYYRTDAGILETLTVSVYRSIENGTRIAPDGRTEAEILKSYTEASAREIISRLMTKSETPVVSVSEMCDELGVNRSSVHKALARLHIKTSTLREGKIGKPKAVVGWRDFIKVMNAYDRPLDPTAGSGSFLAALVKPGGAEEQIVYCPSCGYAISSESTNQGESKPK